MARLEPIFQLISPAASASARQLVMLVMDEYPCRDVRGGGLFNAGTYFIRKHPITDSILGSWLKSRFHGGALNADWPARQGAFSHDPAVYLAHAEHIKALPSGCIAASPFAPLIGHILGGIINGVYDPRLARDGAQWDKVSACVLDSLSKRRPASCALNPVDVGAAD